MSREGAHLGSAGREGAGRPGVRPFVAGVLAAVLLGSALLWQDRTTVERGNRLYRSGDTLAAIDIYRERVAGADSAAMATYNLGTALVTLDPDEAGKHLLQVVEGDEVEGEGAELVRRGHYNLGYGLLTGLKSLLPSDSAIALLTGAVRSNRIALRLDVNDEDARWNLALSQRLLDSLMNTGQYSEQQEVSGRDETRIENVAITRSPMGEGISGREPEQAQLPENIGQRTGGSEGAREAWVTQDPGPVSDVEATRLVEAVLDGPELLVRGILWSQRPDVAWWSRQPYPGGGW